MTEGTAKCPICGKPYKWYAFTVVDQSACPDCVREANRQAEKHTTDTRTYPQQEIRK